MKIICNIDEKSNHKKAIAKNLAYYNEAYIAVAFFKMSGFNILKESIKTFLEKNGKLVIIVGQNFGITEPNALKEMRKLLVDSPSSKLFLAKANSAEDIFHPKLYLFKSDNKCCLISGSANLTQGGLIKNKEISLSIECMISEILWKDTKNYFDSLIDPLNANEASPLTIKQYESFYEQQKQYNKGTKVVPDQKQSQILFNYANLLKHLKKINKEKREQQYEGKLDDYKKAKAILDEIADTSNLNQKKFEKLLDNLVGSKGNIRLWHSGSLYRKRRSVYPFFKEFSELVNYIRDNRNKPANIVFENGKRMVDKIEGAAANYLAEIMMTYNHNSFANINKNPLTVLRSEGGVSLKSHSSSFTGEDYLEYCELISEIASLLKIRDMLEIDTFFNKIYWEIKK